MSRFITVAAFLCLIAGALAQGTCGNLNLGGTAYTLSYLAEHGPFSASAKDSGGQLNTLQFDVCGNLPTPCPLNDGSGGPSSCANANSAGACQQWPGGSACCGKFTDTSVVALYSDNNGGKGLSVTYTGGDNCQSCSAPRSTVINIICDPNTSNLPKDIVLTLPTPGPNINPVYTITMKHVDGCPGGGGSGGLSAGSVMLIIIFSCFAAYMLGGVVFMKVRTEETGARLIPNYDFWSDLPALVRDGMMFIVNKIRGGGGGGYTPVPN